MILYHGSYLEIAEPDLVHSRLNVDFGRASHVTPLYEQAKKWCANDKVFNTVELFLRHWI